MREAVSDILSARSREAEGLGRMVMLSLAAHVVLVAVLVLMPADWRTTSREPDATPMFISLGGAPGPDAGGMTQMAGRQVQAVGAPEPRQRFTVPPAAALPPMVIPEPAAKPAPKTPPKPVEKPAERSTGRKPITGEEVRSGAARVDTGGVPVPFGGLSRSGGGGTGALSSDLSGFCCPDYVATMNQLIHAQWNERQGVAGQVTVRFTILRDGRLTNVEVAQTSGNPILDLESRRAVLNTQKLPPLPPAYAPQTLTVNLIFQYQR